MARADPKSRKPKSSSLAQGHLSLVVGKTRPQWAAEINGHYDRGIAGFEAAARSLLDAREGPGKLPHGEFGPMVKNDLKMSPTMSRMLMAIERDEVFSNRQHADVLPSSWDTRYKLLGLPKEVKEEKIADGTIHPGMQRKDVQVLRLLYLPPPKPRKPRTAAPNPSADDDKEQEHLRGFFGPLGACVVEVKQRVFDALQEIPAAERAVLFTALRQQLEELEQDFPVEAQP
jgi:hypothetical protein